ncbi:Protein DETOXIFICATION 27, partial [Ancistrocladus abbreviatus]
MENSKGNTEEINQPLMEKESQLLTLVIGQSKQGSSDGDLGKTVWIETKTIWHIMGPAIFSRVASFSMKVVTQAFAAHLGELPLVAISIANTVNVGFSFGLL